jgi:triose/dihydroxyacetone kinase / FAD-AMP lyase (cyclizing)
MDTLIPFVLTFSDTLDFQKASKVCMQGAESTRSLVNKFGRASYVDTQQALKENVPDAGAWGLASIISGISSVKIE